MDIHELHQALCTPGCYPQALLAPGPGGAPTVVETLETHLSHLYFVGPRVYKLKKPVRFAFVDFSTLARRRQACDDEVRLNRRLAPGVYRGVVAITRDAFGRVHVGSAEGPAPLGEPLEWAVEMERLPAAAMLDARLARGEVDRALLERLVATLAEFHRGAERSPELDAHATPAALARRFRGNLAEAEVAGRRLGTLDASFAGGAPPRLLGHVRESMARFLATERDLLLRRVAEGRICEGHGDLHAGNVCLLPERVVAFDCIEFARELRALDVAADLAFLWMDVARRGFPAFARDLARLYAERTADPELPRLLPVYGAHLACVRGKVALLRALGDDEATVRRESRREAWRCFALAARLLLPPFVVVTCGLPGSGKSHAARLLAPRLDARHVQSDFERKRLAGALGTAPPPRADLYTDAMTRRTYDELRRLGEETLLQGRSVLLDATFARVDQREPVRAWAAAAGVPCVFLCCRADPAEAQRRLRARAGDPAEWSDADGAVLERARARFEPPHELPADARVDLGPEVDPEAVTIALLERVLVQRAARASERDAG